MSITSVPPVKLRGIQKHRGASKSDLMTFETTSNYYSNSSGNYGSRVLSLFTEEMYGQRIVDYRARKASGELLPHTAFLQHRAEGTAEGYQNIYETWGSGYWRRSIINNFVASLPNHSKSPFMGDTSVVLPYYYIDVEEALGYADESYLSGLIQEAQSSIYSSGHDTLTFISELHKVRDLFAKIAERHIRRILSNQASSNRTLKREAFRRLKNKPGEWLEARYGWRTLLYDLKDLHGAILTMDDHRKRWSQRAGFSQSGVSVVPSTETSTYIGSYVFNTTTEWEVSYRGSVVADISPPQFAFNPVTTAWELLPWSFVIDWLIGIGTWLNSLSFLTLSNGHVSSGGYQVRLRRTLDRRVLSWKVVAGVTYSGVRELQYEMNTITQKRIPMSASYLPAIRLKLGLAKVVDLGALIYQLIR